MVTSPGAKVIVGKTLDFLLQVYEPEEDAWIKYNLPETSLPVSGVTIGANAVILGWVANNTRLLVCGGANSVLEIISTCFYMERNGGDLVIGGAPEMDRGLRGACSMTDGNNLVYFGGNARRADG